MIIMNKQNTKIVLDTSIFVNPDSRQFFGKSPREALVGFIKIIKTKNNLSCYIPPSVYQELIKFTKELPADKDILIKKKSPASYQDSIPALLFYEFIDETRARINKGLRITEKYTRQGLKKEDNREAAQELIQSARQEYRIALREGILDSKEDFDLILVAKELEAYLATSDKGLIKWAQKLGIICLSAEELKSLIFNPRS
ncbi:MAG: RNA ligase partner protein [Candidatus Omnitrophica bacterium]|nr:RNA ligase partner protein [Candidatus Omnitrophota bacterium]MCF7894765.1 RNA ligase partner protein [Candidatus Omnitrophota bacterium]